MKKSLFFTSLMIVLLSFPYKANSAELNINFHPQHTPVWCWAATIAMVVEYAYGNSIEDCEVLTRYDLRLGGQGLCCQGDGNCMRTGQLNEMGQILGNLYGIQGEYIDYPPTYAQIVNSINLNYPIIAALQQQNGNGHVVVISGYTNSNDVIVLDPLVGRQVVNYNTIISNFVYGTWRGSFLIRGANGIPPLMSRRCGTHFFPCMMNALYQEGSNCWCPTPQGAVQGRVY